MTHETLLYFLGNEDIHLLTARTSQELRVDLQKFSGEKAYAKYSTFTVGSESQKYRLTVGGYSGTAGKNIYNSYQFNLSFILKILVKKSNKKIKIKV